MVELVDPYKMLSFLMSCVSRTTSWPASQKLQRLVSDFNYLVLVSETWVSDLVLCFVHLCNSNGSFYAPDGHQFQNAFCLRMGQ